MSEILIVGAIPLSRALERALEVFNSTSVQAPRDEPKWIVHDGELTSQQRKSWLHEIKQFDVIVASPSLLRRTSETVALVHRLRTDLYWEGGFVAVALDDTRAEELREASFIGEPIEETYFGQVPGHVVLTVPLQIPDLLSVLNGIDDEISPEYWHFDLLRSGQAAQLNRQIKKATRALNDLQVEVDVRSVSREIMTSLDTIDWSLVAERERGHALANSVRSFLQEHGAKEHLTIEDCSFIVKRAKHILAHSTFPFPSED